MPRPPEMTVSASVSSGSPVETSSRRSTNFICAPAAVRLGRSIVADLPRGLAPGGDTVGPHGATPPGLPHLTLQRRLARETRRGAAGMAPPLPHAPPAPP